MIFLQIGLTLIYFVFTSWLVIATFVNYLLKPYFVSRGSGTFRLEGSISWTYAVMWGLALTVPIVYGLILDPA